MQRFVSLLGAVAVGAALTAPLPGAPAQSDPVLPVPSPTLPLPLPSLEPSPDPSEPLDLLPEPGGEIPGGGDSGSGADQPSSGGGDSTSGGSGPTGGGAGPRPADPTDPGGDMYPHPPFAPVAGNRSAALLQAVYDAQARQRSLQNQIARVEADLTRVSVTVSDTKTSLASARKARDLTAEGIRDSVRAIYKSGAPYPVYTALASARAPGVIRNGARDRLTRYTTATERVDLLEDRLAAAVDDRDALATKLARLKAALEQATSTVNRYLKASAADLSAGVPDSGVPAGRLMWPVRGQVTSEYGNRYDPYYRTWQLHAGLDIAAPTGTPVRAAAGGRVVRAGMFGGYGNYVCVAHGRVRDQQMTTCYGHLSKIGVRGGQSVATGQSVGEVGSTGASTGPHLHFEVRLGGRPANPRLWL